MATFLVCHGAWSAGWAWKKVRPLLRAAGHEVFTPTYTGLGERAHQASPAVDLETHIADTLAVLEFEDLRDVTLVGHSYGGMVATGVADRARAGPHRPADLSRCLRAGERAEPHGPGPAASRQRQPGAGRPGMADPAQSLSARHPGGRPRLAQAASPAAAGEDVHAKLELRNGPLTLPRSYIYCTRKTPDDVFLQFSKRLKTDPAWRYFEIDSSHSPNVTAPAALAKLLEEIAR